MESIPRVISVDCYLKHWIVRYLKNGSGPAWGLRDTSRKTHGRISFTDLEFETKDAAVDYAIEVAKKMTEYYGDARVDVSWHGQVKETVLVKAPIFEEPKWNPPRVIEWGKAIPSIEEDVGEPYEPHSTEINEFGKDFGMRPHLRAR